MLTLILLSSLAADPLAPVYAARVEVLRIHDADTITSCTIHLGFGVSYSPPAGIRATFDAHEVNHQRKTVNVTDVEMELGKRATQELVDLLGRGTLYVEDAHHSGKYDRPATIWWVLPSDGTPWIYVPLYAEQHGWLREPRHVTEATGGAP